MAVLFTFQNVILDMVTFSVPFNSFTLSPGVGTCIQRIQFKKKEMKHKDLPTFSSSHSTIRTPR
jgi:hypothetical protein